MFSCKLGLLVKIKETPSAQMSYAVSFIDYYCFPPIDQSFVAVGNRIPRGTNSFLLHVTIAQKIAR